MQQIRVAEVAEMAMNRTGAVHGTPANPAPQRAKWPKWPKWPSFLPATSRLLPRLLRLHGEPIRLPLRNGA